MTTKKIDAVRRTVNTVTLATLVVGLATITMSTPSFAGNFRQNHPRRAQVLGRDNRMNRQINNDYGHLGGNYGKLEHEDNTIRSQEQRDARQNGGYITKGEQRQFNREEGGLERQVDRDSAGRGNGGGNGHWQQFSQNHPRRAEVLGRDGTENRELNNDAGRLNGQYGNLKTEDQSIRSQEQTDARANGGYITQQQKQQLNQEENQLQRQINRDNSQ